MLWKFKILSEGARSTPHGVVIHAAGEKPQWSTTNKAAERNFKILFEREEVYANVPQIGGGYLRVKKTYDSQDYLDYASTKVNLPLFVMLAGQWETAESPDIILEILANKYISGDKDD